MSIETPRLSASTLARAAPAVARPGYDRSGLVPGVLHFGPGAFHRAHQAAYLDVVLAHDSRWAISEVALNSSATADALRPQNGLYTLVLMGEETRYRVIGSIAELLTRDDAEAIADRLAAPTTRLVTATVTEKGYHLTAEGGLDTADPLILADLRSESRPATLIGWLVRGLERRRSEGSGGLTVLSCDNLAANGRRLRRAVLEFAQLRGGDLARWIEYEVRFPSSMVDSITPATDSALRKRIRAATGLDDAWPIQRETFTQWVVEDDFAGERPPLDVAGVQFTRDVTAFEDAKLRLLNGAHSSLAYLGLLLGHETVFDAMTDAALARFVEQLMRDDIAPTLHPAEGLEIGRYITAVLARFRNPAIRHQLGQIAWDGSQKLPFRLIATARDALAAGRPVGRLALPVAAWFRFLALERPPAPPLVDPLATRLTALARIGPRALMLESGVFPPELTGEPAYVDAVLQAHDAMGSPQDVDRRLRMD